MSDSDVDSVLVIILMSSFKADGGLDYSAVCSLLLGFSDEAAGLNGF